MALGGRDESTESRQSSSRHGHAAASGRHSVGVGGRAGSSPCADIMRVAAEVMVERSAATGVLE